MPETVVNGTAVYFRDEGRGPAVLLGHSSTGTGGQWRALIERLRSRCRLIAPDHIGYGRTGAHAGAGPLMQDEVAITARLARLSPEPLHLVGHSYGGAVLTRLALLDPVRVRSLTLVEPTLFHLLAPAGHRAADLEIRGLSARVVERIDAGRAKDAARDFIDYWVTAGAYDAMSERLRESVATAMSKLRVEWETAFMPLGATPEALARLSGPSLPIRLIVGGGTTAAARGVVEVLRGIWPRARFTEVAGVGHMAPVTEPERINPIIEAFLDHTTAGGS